MTTVLFILIFVVAIAAIMVVINQLVNNGVFGGFDSTKESTVLAILKKERNSLIITNEMVSIIGEDSYIAKIGLDLYSRYYFCQLYKGRVFRIRNNSELDKYITSLINGHTNNNS